MKSYAMALDLREGPGVVEEYARYHRAVWPEVMEGLKEIGISKMRIFLHGRRLFMYLEAPDDFDLSRWDRLYETFCPSSRVVSPACSTAEI